MESTTALYFIELSTDLWRKQVMLNLEIQIVQILSLAGTGGSDLPDLKAEFTDIAHTRGTLSAARSASPDSANSQFFICFDEAPHLDRQYSAFGKVIKGMNFIDMIKKGDQNSGSVANPDKIISLKLK